MTLFGDKFIPHSVEELAEYLLRISPWAKENVHEFEIAAIEFLLEKDLTPAQKARITKFSLYSLHRRRQEMQKENPELSPSPEEKFRRMSKARI